ncbi:MAG TPA: TniB family NTP-binding protein [Pyrinomonadaceae bacterium]|nr:TniB family NTP-binding protein [Pyrinomonadaceae bacterium]
MIYRDRGNKSGKDDTDNSKVSAEERIRLTEQIYISYPRLKEVEQKIAYCHEFSKMSAEPVNLLIQGETGTGKTTCLKRYEHRYPRYETEEGAIVPVISAAIPVPATVKSLVTKLLIGLGDPLAEKGTVVNQTLRFLRLIKACDVQLIILDEFQHVIDRDSDKVLKTVSDWLKNLINESKIPIVLIGMPYCDVILEANAQLKRRFSSRISIEPFGWDTNEQRQDFRKFLRAVDVKLPLEKRSNLADEDMAYRFFCASDGTVANVMQVARRATTLAIDRSMKSLDLAVLAEAYDERLAANYPQKPNPFTE